MTLPHRIASIDIFRSLTMFLMIFVNDLWTLRDIPAWLGHSAAQDDAMGLADVVFPAFLFIVGLSIPYAVSNRLKRGDSRSRVALHIIERAIILLVMGLFTVNLENINAAALPINRSWWQVSMVLGFFLLWNDYTGFTEKRSRYLRIAGLLILLLLAAVYRGGTSEAPTWMQTHWWGILGLIGWAYLVCSLVYLLAGDRPVFIVAAWLFFVGFNVATFAGYTAFLSPIRPYMWLPGDGAIQAFTMAGVTASVLLRSLFSRDRKWSGYLITLLVIGLLCLLSGYELRPFWGISKIRSTPAWVGMCTGLSFIAYAFVFWLCDVKAYQKWSNWLRPAGIATLTCYFLPYLIYPLASATGIALPTLLVTGLVGIVKSLAFAVLVVWLTGRLVSWGVRLKV